MLLACSMPITEDYPAKVEAALSADVDKERYGLIIAEFTVNKTE